MRSLERAGRYQAMITAVLAEERFPQDLIYQAVAESGFQPQAVNGRSGAGGMWQFMPYGVYGLEPQWLGTMSASIRKNQPTPTRAT